MDELNRLVETNIKLARFCVYTCMLNLAMLFINFFGIAATKDILLKILDKL